MAFPERTPPDLATLARMTRPKLFYFDIPASRGEECRLALHLAGVDFEDVRIKFPDWPALKPSMPYGGMPVLELPGRPPLAHSNAILTFLGRSYGLHPKDDLEAARHEAMMCHVEDLRATVGPTLRIKDEAAKKEAREGLRATFLPAWGAAAERNILAAPFFGGEKLSVVDLKIFVDVRWFAGGSVDHIPATVFAEFPKLTGVYERVRDHDQVKTWYAKAQS